MKTWVIPYVDLDLSFWAEVVDQFGSDILEVYFPTPDGLIASGRSRQPEKHLAAFLRHARLDKAVLLNPILLTRPVEEAAPVALNTLKQLYEDYGVQSVTVQNLTLAKIIRSELPHFRITGSTLMGVMRPAQAMIVRDVLHSLTPDTSILRDLPALRQLRAAFPGELRLIVNEGCLPGCLYRTQHFYEMGYGDFFPASLCLPLLEQQPWLRLTGAWVLPQHLKYYEGLYDSLKLAGRVTLRDPVRYLTVLHAYVNRTPLKAGECGGGPASLTAPIDVSDSVFRTILNCDKNCGSCSVCREYYNHAVAATGGKNV